MVNPLFKTLFGRHHGAETPFLHLSDGKVLTHAAFLQTAARFAHALVDAGLRPGERLAVQVDKSPEALALYAACVQAGIIFLPLNTGYTPSEVDYFVGNSGAKLLVGPPRTAEGLGEIASRHGARFLTLDADGTGSFAEAARRHPDMFETVPREESDLAAFLYTSGTTGRSKGAMLSQANLLSNAETLARYWRFTAADVLIHALPIFHTHGLFVATNVTLIAGGSMVFLPKFDPDAVLAALPSATAMMGVPTFYTRLLADARLTREAAAKMRLFVSGSAPLLAETHRQFEARTGHRILERYGMTETNMNTSNPYDGERRPGTVGMPLPGVELKVTEPEAGVEMSQGEVGVVEVRGPNVFQGYWQMPEKTAEDLRSDGFFITGDLGRIDEDGYLTIVGRGKDLIISGGFNVYPKEIESVLDDMPGVLESAVIGAPHPDFGESVVAVLVPEQGATPDTSEIGRALRDRLAGYKQPRLIETIDELPRNTMGKVEKATLRERYRNAFS